VSAIFFFCNSPSWGSSLRSLLAKSFITFIKHGCPSLRCTLKAGSLRCSPPTLKHHNQQEMSLVANLRHQLLDLGFNFIHVSV
jgi:hypothetical protein